MRLNLGYCSPKSGSALARPKYHVITACDVIRGTEINYVIKTNMAESDKSEKKWRDDYCVAGIPNGQSRQNTKRKGFKLHKFPKDPIVRAKWVKFVRKHQPDFQDPTSKYTSLYSAHFENDCYKHNKLVVDAIGQNSGLEM